MTRHQKRLSVPKSWPVERKTNVFTVKAGAGPHGEAGVPLLIVLRDVLGYVDSRKEARYALSTDGILVNGEPVNDERRPIGMFDIVAFPERAEHYRVFPDEGGRLALSPIDAEAADSRLGKIIRKHQEPGGATQLTLHDGTTITVDDDYATKDSIVIDVDDASVVAHFPYEEGALVTAVSGNHGGKIGTLASIDVTLGSGSNVVTVETDDGTFETIEEYVFVIDEHFVEDDEPAATEEEPDEDATEASDATEEPDEDATEASDATEEPDEDATEEPDAAEEPDEDATEEPDAADESDEAATEEPDDAEAADEEGGEDA